MLVDGTRAVAFGTRRPATESRRRRRRRRRRGERRKGREGPLGVAPIAYSGEECKACGGDAKHRDILAVPDRT